MTARRAALYARTSTVGHGQDIGLQLDELRQVARQREWQIAAEFTDEGISGSQDRRPGLDALLDAARRGQIDLVAVWKIDRLGRSLQHLLRTIEELARLGVAFVSLRDTGIDTTSAQGRLLLGILGSFAEYERALIQERVKAGVARARAAGKHCGRPSRKLDLRAARALLEQGSSLRQVASMLGLPKTTLLRRLREAGPEASPAELHQAEAGPGPEARSTS